MDYCGRNRTVLHGPILGERQPHFLIATGTSPALPNIPGLAETPHLTSDLLTSGEGLELREIPKSLVIIGGGYIALELGQMFSRLGAQITILERGERVLQAYEPEISDSVMDVFRDEGITVHTKVKVKRVRSDGGEALITAEISGREKELRAAQLLVATGRKANTEQLGLELPGVETDDPGFVKANDELRTSADHVYAAGEVIDSHAENHTGWVTRRFPRYDLLSKVAMGRSLFFAWESSRFPAQASASLVRITEPSRRPSHLHLLCSMTMALLRRHFDRRSITYLLVEAVFRAPATMHTMNH
jgi:NAD(P)H-nitrite reductase large subunit